MSKNWSKSACSLVKFFRLDFSSQYLFKTSTPFVGAIAHDVFKRLVAPFFRDGNQIWGKAIYGQYEQVQTLVYAVIFLSDGWASRRYHEPCKDTLCFVF